MINDLRLVAHVTNLEPEVEKYCAGREDKFPYFRQGFVDLDLARHTLQTEAIRLATDGFALANKDGQVLQRYSTFAAAESARKGAVIRLAPDIAMEESLAEAAMSNEGGVPAAVPA